jgi:hypothetical protein
MTDMCSDMACLLVLNQNQIGNISNRHYPRIIVSNKEFYTELEKMKKETSQMENFDLGLYMDGKIALGYVEDVEGLTLDEGELINLKCWAPSVIKWWKVAVGLLIVKIGSSIAKK